jgi:hypothetical protein
MIELPGTSCEQSQLRTALIRVPERHREDAVQEAWLAYLTSRTAGSKYPARAATHAIVRFSKREKRWERGQPDDYAQTVISQMDPLEAEKVDEVSGSERNRARRAVEENKRQHRKRQRCTKIRDRAANSPVAEGEWDNAVRAVEDAADLADTPA